MAKDNQRKPSDPGTAKKTNKVNASQAKRPKTRDKWKKPHWVSYALEVGIEGAEKKTVKEIKAQLKQLVQEGKIENQNGGVREGSGRKPINVLENVKTAQEMIADHALTEVEMVIRDPNNPTAEPVRTKMTRVEALMVRLFMDGSKGNVSASREYLDRFMGRPKQSIEHSGEIKTEEQNVPTPAEVAAAQAYEEALERGESVKSPIQV